MFPIILVGAIALGALILLFGVPALVRKSRRRYEYEDQSYAAYGGGYDDPYADPYAQTSYGGGSDMSDYQFDRTGLNGQIARDEPQNQAPNGFGDGIAPAPHGSMAPTPQPSLASASPSTDQLETTQAMAPPTPMPPTAPPPVAHTPSTTSTPISTHRDLTSHRREASTVWSSSPSRATADPLNSHVAPVPRVDAPRSWQHSSGARRSREQSVLDVPASALDIPTEVEESSPIFDQLNSEWFSGGGSGNWSSPGDAGWKRAAELEKKAASTPAPLTNQGLPMRSPGAQLMPGSVDEESSSPPAPRRAARRPAAAAPVHANVHSLASFQKGVSRARGV